MASPETRSSYHLTNEEISHIGSVVTRVVEESKKHDTITDLQSSSISKFCSRLIRREGGLDVMCRKYQEGYRAVVRTGKNLYYFERLRTDTNLKIFCRVVFGKELKRTYFYNKLFDKIIGELLEGWSDKSIVIA